jgi:hypothetical protein
MKNKQYQQDQPFQAHDDEQDDPKYVTRRNQRNAFHNKNRRNQRKGNGYYKGIKLLSEDSSVEWDDDQKVVLFEGTFYNPLKDWLTSQTKNELVQFIAHLYKHNFVQGGGATSKNYEAQVQANALINPNDNKTRKIGALVLARLAIMDIDGSVKLTSYGVKVYRKSVCFE